MLALLPGDQYYAQGRSSTNAKGAGTSRTNQPIGVLSSYMIVEYTPAQTISMIDPYVHARLKIYVTLDILSFYKLWGITRGSTRFEIASKRSWFSPSLLFNDDNDLYAIKTRTTMTTLNFEF